MNTAWWKQYDWWLIGAIVLLITISLLMLLSITMGTNQPYARNQAIFAVVGLAMFAVLARLDYRWLIQFAPMFYGTSLLLLLIVAGFAQITRGAASWLDLGIFSLQPSEFMKLSLILLMAYIYEKVDQKPWNNYWLIGLYMAAALPPLALILLQPDLGTAAVLLSAWLGVLWMSPVSKKILTGLGVGLAVMAVIGWLFLAPYQQQRVMTFLNPAADPLGHGYNVLQSIIAVGSGGWLGQGWSRGTQSHLNFLPEHHTDFIFASLSEELGFIGALLVLALYGIVFWRGIAVIWRSTSQSEVIIVGGVIAMLLVQAGINIAMNVGLAPVTGIPLPMVSYGGSSLMVTLIGLGVIHGIYRHQKINTSRY